MWYAWGPFHAGTPACKLSLGPSIFQVLTSGKLDSSLTLRTQVRSVPPSTHSSRSQNTFLRLTAVLQSPAPTPLEAPSDPFHHSKVTFIKSPWTHTSWMYHFHHALWSTYAVLCTCPTCSGKLILFLKPKMMLWVITDLSISLPAPLYLTDQLVTNILADSPLAPLRCQWHTMFSVWWLANSFEVMVTDHINTL